MSWKVLKNARGHGCNPNGIIDLLCREHFSELVEYAGVPGMAYSFDHYTLICFPIERERVEIDPAFVASSTGSRFFGTEPRETNRCVHLY
jgi:hypothetical protein